MAYFAHIDDNNIVDNVIVADQDFIDSGAVGDPSEWIECDPDTRSGVNEKGGTPMRKNYPAKGFSYDRNNDRFVRPKPNSKPSWIIDDETGDWKPPVDRPTMPLAAPFDWVWSEAEVKWVKEEIDDRDPKIRNQCLIDGNCVIDPVTGKIVDK